MSRSFVIIISWLMLSACGGMKTQTDSAGMVVVDSIGVDEKAADASMTAEQKRSLEAVKSFVEQFYNEWDKRDLLDYEYVKQHITPNLLKFLADSYDFDCEGECLATWKFFYEGGGDVSGRESRQITALDENHVLVENKYENYEYAVLLTVIKDGDVFKIDSLQQVKSEYLN